MTDLPRQFKDHLANFGVCSKVLFYGYKLHLITTIDGIPISFFVTKANARESSITDKLFARCKRSLTKKQLDYSAYDSNKVYQEADDYLSAQLIAPPNPRNNRHTKLMLKLRSTPRDIGILLYLSSKGKKKYKKRIILEQSFDQIKDDLCLNFILIKGIRKSIDLPFYPI